MHVGHGVSAAAERCARRGDADGAKLARAWVAMRCGMVAWLLRAMVLQGLTLHRINYKL